MQAELISHWCINKLSPSLFKLQTLLYFAQGISFCMSDKELFSDDFEILNNRLIIRSIYNKYQELGYSVYSPINIKYSSPNLDNNTLSVLEYIKESYNQYDEQYLSDCIRQQTPFLYTKEKSRINSNNTVVPKELISNYFISSMLQPRMEEWDN